MADGPAAGYGLIPDGAVAIDGGRIVWAGPAGALPDTLRGWPAVPLAGRLVTPGLIDCHTHLVYAGSRAREFALRLGGAQYADIARAGGGILSTVTATRAADEAALLAQALPRLDAMLAAGVTTVEVKSGYGLDRETELRQLHIARSLAQARAVSVRTTYLGLHAIPPEFAGRAAAYVADIALPTLRAAAAEGLADAVDAFCEGIAFAPDQVDAFFAAARALGLPVKLHAEQLSHTGGTALAARHGALSADHVEYATAADAAALAAAGTVAVLLPGAFYTLRETQAPPVQAFRDAGVPMAVATDCNPGSSPMTSLPLAMNMACTLFRLTPQEALMGTTVQAARALGLADRGRIAPGLRADLAVWDADHPDELSYRIGAVPLVARYLEGAPC
ncbi:MAG: imidazolonepropionase [Gemmobacter sp.]